MRRVLMLVLVGLALAGMVDIVSASYTCCSSEYAQDSYSLKNWRDCAANTRQQCDFRHLNFGSCRDHHDPSGYCYICCDKVCQSGWYNCDGSWSNGCESTSGPRDGYCGSWSSWSACSASCGGGVRTRTRSYTQPRCGGSHDSCANTLTQTESCNTQSCCTPSCDAGDVNVTSCGVSLPDGCGSTCSGLVGTFCDEGVCSSGECVSLGTLEWKDLNDRVIRSADLGDAVKMSVAGLRIEDYEANFTVNVGAEVVWWNPLTWFAGGSADISVAEDIYVIENLSDHTFDVDVPALGISNSSDVLTIDSVDNDDVLKLALLGPACGSHFNVTDTVEVIINASDADDVIEGELKINGDFIQNFSNGITYINHTFAEDGNYQILVEANSSNGNAVKDYINIMVIDPTKNGDYVAACIDEPADASNVGTGAVYFNAASSKGIRQVANGATTEVRLPSSDLRLDWLFSNTLENPYHDGSHVNSYSFTANFVDAGNNWATLEVSLL